MLKSSVVGERVPLFVSLAIALTGIAGTGALAFMLSKETKRPPVTASPGLPTPESDTVSEPQNSKASTQPTTGDAGPRFEKHNSTTSDAAPPPEHASCPDLPTFFFATGDENPKSREHKQVARVATWLAENPDATLIIEGHTDGIGAAKKNLVLSYERALAIASLFERAGVDRDRVVARAFGSFRRTTDSAAASGTDRRVSLATTGRPQCPGGTNE